MRLELLEKSDIPLIFNNPYSIQVTWQYVPRSFSAQCSSSATLRAPLRMTSSALFAHTLARSSSRACALQDDKESLVESMMESQDEQLDRLRLRNTQLEDELELLRGVLALVKEDLHVKNDQVDHLYRTYVAHSKLTCWYDVDTSSHAYLLTYTCSSFLASKELTRQEQAQREYALKQRVDELQSQIQAQTQSNARLHTSLQRTTQLLRQQQQQRERYVHWLLRHKLSHLRLKNRTGY